MARPILTGCRTIFPACERDPEYAENRREQNDQQRVDRLELRRRHLVPDKAEAAIGQLVGEGRQRRPCLLEASQKTALNSM